MKQELHIRVCRWIGRLFFMIVLLIQNSNVMGETLEEEKEAIIALVIPSPVIASVTSGGALRTLPSSTSAVIYTARDTQSVEIIKDYSRQWYFVKDCCNGKRGWVRASDLTIPEDPETITIPMGHTQLERFVNIMEFESETDCFVWADISRQVIHIFNGSKGEWHWLRTLRCTTGTNESPTIRGLFKIEDRGDWFYSDRLKSGAMYWVRFHDAYLFHSHIMDQNQNIIDTTLGQRKSNGCVRMAVKDARWFYQNIPEGSRVLIH